MAGSPYLRTLRHLRLDRHFSLQQLADRSGVSKGQISQIERGVRIATAAEAQKLADALGVPNLETRVQLVFEAGEAGGRVRA